MFIRFSALVPVAALVAVVAAAPNALGARQSSSECSTGSAQCCTTTSSSTEPTTASLLGLLDVVVTDVTGTIGLGCSPISLVSVGGGAVCNQEPVCCNGNTFNGLINIGCSPINIYL